MLLPYSTDAPLYHYPISTVTLIVLNVLCFFAFCTEPEPTDFTSLKFQDPSGQIISMEEIEEELTRLEATGEDVEAFFDSLKPVQERTRSLDWLILEFGKGWLPWQWVTNMFMHADLIHLIGNMIFLWSFGLVVEGKIGNIAFPLLYLAMGIVQSALVQTLMLFSFGGALGASGAIFALMALVVIFAPVNSFEVILFFGRVAAFEMPILAFGGFYLLLNIVFFFIGGAGMSSEALHLAGFAVGVPVGLFMLTRGYVDCEGFDIISHFTDQKGKDSTVGKKQLESRQRAKESKGQTVPTTPEPTEIRNRIHNQIETAITEGKLDAAVALQRNLSRQVPGTLWQQPHLAAIIQGYLRNKEFAKAETLMLAHIEMFEKNRTAMQVYLIRLWLNDKRPRHALRYMKGLNPAFMTQEQRDQIRKLADVAKKQIDEGVIELQ